MFDQQQAAKKGRFHEKVGFCFALLRLYVGPETSLQVFKISCVAARSEFSAVKLGTSYEIVLLRSRSHSTYLIGMLAAASVTVKEGRQRKRTRQVRALSRLSSLHSVGNST